MTLKKQYKSLSKRFTQEHQDLIDSFLDKKFDPFQIDRSFNIDSKSIPEERLGEDSKGFTVKEIFVLPSKKEHAAFCIALARSDKSCYEILLNDSTDKTDEFYSNLIELINLMIANKDVIKKYINHNQKVIKACTALSGILYRLSQDSIFKKKPASERTDPPGFKVKPQEGNCAVINEARSPDH